jgi:hypothetical protein
LSGVVMRCADSNIGGHTDIDTELPNALTYK